MCEGKNLRLNLACVVRDPVVSQHLGSTAYLVVFPHVHFVTLTYIVSTPTKNVSQRTSQLLMLGKHVYNHKPAFYLMIPASMSRVHNGQQEWRIIKQFRHRLPAANINRIMTDNDADRASFHNTEYY